MITLQNHLPVKYVKVAKGSPYKVLKMKKALMLHTCIPIANALLSLKLVKIMKSR